MVEPSKDLSTVTCTPIGWDELARKFENADEYIWRGMDTAFRRMGKDILVPALKDNTPKGATGKLKKTTRGEVLGKGDDLRLEVRQLAWRGDYPYGVGVRMGTRPHMPPYKALIPWVVAKWHATPKDAPRRAWFLAKHIQEHGTKANPYHVKTLEEKKGTLRGVIEDEVQKACDQLTDIAGGSASVG